MQHKSALRGVEHDVDFPGALRAALVGDRARGGASGCLEMFQNAGSR